MKTVILLLLSCLFFRLSAQTRLEVKDKNTGKSIPGVNLCFQELRTGKKLYYATAGNGEAQININVPVSIVASAIGYQTYQDTLNSLPVKIELAPENYSVEEVVITGQPEPTKVKNSAYTIKVINLDKESTKANLNLKDILKEELNIRIVEDLALGSGIEMQGLSGGYVKYMIDGVPIIGRLGGNIDLTQINLQNIERIEIIEGPMSVLYGTDALAGTINLISKTGRGKTQSIDISQYYESVALSNTQASAIIGNKQRKVGLSGGYYTFGGFRFDNTLKRGYNWKPKDKINGELFYSQNIAGWYTKLTGRLYKEKLSSYGEMTGLPQALDDYFNTARYDIALNASKKLTSKVSMQTVASYNQYERTKESFIKNLTTLKETSAGNTTTKYQDAMIRSSLSLKQLIKNTDVLTGFEFRHDDSHGQKIEGNEKSMQDGAVFISIIHKPTPFLTFQPGARFIYNSKYSAPLMYSANVKADLFLGTSWRISYAKGFKAPSMQQLYYVFVDSSHEIYGNSELDAETSDNISTNLSWRTNIGTSFIEASVGFYHNHLSNMIDLAYVSGSTARTYVNYNNTTTQGVNANVKLKVNPDLRFRIGASNDAITNEFFSDQSGMNKFLWSKDFSFSANYMLRKHNLELATYFKFNGRRPTYYYNDDSETFESGYQEEFTTLDLNMKKSFFKRRFELTLGVKNILDNVNIEKVGNTGAAHTSASDSYAVGWGRSFFGKVAYKFNKYQ